MKLLDALTSGFIDTFGITRPTDAARRRASWFITGMLTLALLLVAGGGIVLYHLMRQ